METLKIILFFLGFVIVIAGFFYLVIIKLDITGMQQRVNGNIRRDLAQKESDKVSEIKTEEPQDQFVGRYPYAAMQAKRGFIKK